MKDYKDVVAERYDKQAGTDFNARSAMKWMDSQLWMCQSLFDVFRQLDRRGYDIGNLKILEVGCGGGRWTRFMAEITANPTNIKGTDLSSERITVAKWMNPAIKYEVADVVETTIQEKFDVIMAWDVFMHLKSEEQIRKALKNIHQALTERGVFIFFDAWAKTHFIISDAESVGFNPEEVVDLASREGFAAIFRKDVFRIFPGGRHSEQYYGHVPTWLIRLLEMMFPTPGNYFIVFRKSEAK